MIVELQDKEWAILMTVRPMNVIVGYYMIFRDVKWGNSLIICPVSREITAFCTSSPLTS